MGATMPRPRQGRQPPAWRSATRPAEAAGTCWGAPTNACCRHRPGQSPPSFRHRGREFAMRSHHLTIVAPPAPLRAAIYARVSSDQQAERQTIDSQLGDLKACASRDGHRIEDAMLFVDNGHSGTTLVRPALERLRDMVALSAVDVVYVHSPDRLARSYAHQVLLLEEFAGADARVVFLNRPIGDSPEDALLLLLQGMFAEYERAKMLERSRRGKRHRARAGAVSVLSRAPFGYRYVSREAGAGEARYEVDEDAAGVVRRIFAWVGQERLTLAGACRRLLEAGVASPTGRTHWSRAMVHTLLLNPAYTGRAVYGRRRCVPWRAPLRPPRGHDGPPRRPWRQVPAPPERHIQVPVPAIVDEALFAAAAEQLAENRRRNRERLAGLRYLLRGLLVCRKCGYCFTGYNPKPATTPSRGATTGAAAPTAASSKARSAATPTCWPSNRWRRRCGTRPAGSCASRRACWRSTSDAWTRSPAGRAGTSSMPCSARATRSAVRSTASSTAS